jgi:hypothetical protein
MQFDGEEKQSWFRFFFGDLQCVGHSFAYVTNL